MDLIAAGDHVAARIAAQAVVADGDSAEDAKADAAAALAATDADPWAIRTFAMTGAFVAVLAWLALVPHATVGAARTFVEAVAHADEAKARALFSEEAWTATGAQLFGQFQGQHGRAYARSRRGEELGFVLVSFDDPPTRRYLRFDEASGLVKAVTGRRPRKPKPPAAGQ